MKSRTTKGIFQLSRKISSLDRSQSIVDNNEYSLYTTNLQKTGRRTMDEQKQVPQVLDNLNKGADNKGQGQKHNNTNNSQNAKDLPPRLPQKSDADQNKGTQAQGKSQTLERLPTTLTTGLSGTNTPRKDDSHNAKIIVTGCQRNKSLIERHINQNVFHFYDKNTHQQMRYSFQEACKMLKLDKSAIDIDITVSQSFSVYEEDIDKSIQKQFEKHILARRTSKGKEFFKLANEQLRQSKLMLNKITDLNDSCKKIQQGMIKIFAKQQLQVEKLYK